MTLDLRLGDSRAELKKLEGASVDALVTDPPAGIGFMGKAWDHHLGGREEWIDAYAAIFLECLRVLKPGAHGLVWALPRTSHWTATALEEAGFEIRDRVSHMFGTGFPKSLNLDGGLGTALKPACEDWWLVRKPLDGTVAANVAEHGTGALNIDGCRIDSVSDADREALAGSGGWAKKGYDTPERVTSVLTGCVADGKPKDAEYHPSGRWPANVTLDEEAAALLDEQSGELVSGEAHVLRRNTMKFRNLYSPMRGQTVEDGTYGDRGGASRFFYVAKPDRAERDIGCEDLPAASGGAATDRKDRSAGLDNPRAGAGRNGGARNIHPTVKSIDLMRWLCRLITPRGGLVLDPFMGSGSTGVACSREGFRFIGIERERAYFEIARRRLYGDAPLLNRACL